jgi:hypothetical protein
MVIVSLSQYVSLEGSKGLRSPHPLQRMGDTEICSQIRDLGRIREESRGRLKANDVECNT